MNKCRIINKIRMNRVYIVKEHIDVSYLKSLEQNFHKLFNDSIYNVLSHFNHPYQLQYVYNTYNKFNLKTFVNLQVIIMPFRLTCLSGCLRNAAFRSSMNLSILFCLPSMMLKICRRF
jgi:hypothetical protein